MVRALLLDTEVPRASQADGDLLPAGPLHVTVTPLAARLLVPSARR